MKRQQQTFKDNCWCRHRVSLSAVRMHLARHHLLNAGEFTLVEIEGVSIQFVVPETKFEEELQQANAEEDSVGKKNSMSEDPFNIYELLNKKQSDNKERPCAEDSLKYPPGFTPIDVTEGQFKKDEGSKKEDGECSPNIHAEEKVSGAKETNVSQDAVSGQRQYLALHRLHLALAGYTDDNTRGIWVPTGKNLLIISVYAPQELSEKKTLWDYFSLPISNWKDEVVLMGDFNEVRTSSERFGSVFNVQGAMSFNMFISKAGLEEVPPSRGVITLTLDHYLSDHRPILLREINYDYGPIPFRLFHYWFEVEGFDKLIEDTWNEAPVDDSNAMNNMIKKLKYLKEKIRVWSNDKKKSSNNSRVLLKEELAALDVIIDKGEGNEGVINKRNNVVNVLQDMEKLKSMEAAQKAKIKWAIEGNENSKYYHGILNKKRCQLTIRGILVEGSWIDSPNIVKNKFLSHFKNRFDKPQQRCTQINMTFPHMITADQKADLESDVFWNVIEKDVVEAVRCFFNYGSFPKGGNSSFIALIPKKPDANMVKDFRPISLIGSLYKIIAKVLANRLVVVLGDIVNEVQSAFVADRQILDGPFILNEVVQWCKAKKKQAMIFKVDFEKAYDSVRWDYLDEVLKKFGFEERWCSWIQGCLKSFRGSVIVNGSPTKEFQFYKGLKQGVAFPFSVYFGDGKSTYLVFKRAWGCSVEALGWGATLKMPFSYLGSNVGGLMSRIQSWNEIVDRVAARLSKWKMKTLSIGGRLTLLKSVLGSIPIYHMSIFKVPMKVLHRIESVRCHFFNGSDRLEKKPIWVKWKSVLASKEKGGLGVSSLYALNRAIVQVNLLNLYPSVWLDIVHEVEKLKGHGIDLMSYIQKKLGNGANTYFWEEIWCGDVEFKRCSLDYTHWKPVALVLMRWLGDFSVASVRKLIDDKTLSEVSTKTRWIKVVPIKVNIHAWKVRLDGLPTRLNISHRGLDIDSILCPLCENAVESSTHISLRCRIV
ncbi:RNA-directed DNA polymerase, eukaryota, reverse transcriptase zinc-binding domain protein [Tanacetum coccineum]